MAVFNKCNSFVEALAEKVHNLGSDTLKVMLSAAAPSSSYTKKADFTEISAGNGYTAGGATLSVTSSAQTGGTYSLVGSAVTITASGGSVGPFRYAILYNDTATNDEAIGWWDYGASLTLADGEIFQVSFPSTILTVA